MSTRTERGRGNGGRQRRESKNRNEESEGIRRKEMERAKEIGRCEGKEWKEDDITYIPIGKEIQRRKENADAVIFIYSVFSPSTFFHSPLPPIYPFDIFLLPRE
jgi:hypothetical protein